MRNLVMVLWCGILAGSAHSAVLLAQTPTAPAPADPVTLISGDSVRITVWRRPEFSGDFIVSPDGFISHPLYRGVRVGGVPFSTAEASLRNFLARFEQDPQFVMEPLVRIAVSGEVGRPQVFVVRPETTIGEAVAQAGGPNQFAQRQRVRVLRRVPNGGQREFYVNLMDGRSGMSRVHSGDQIVVDRRRSFFREIFLPGLSVIGSVASIYLLIDRNN